MIEKITVTNHLEESVVMEMRFPEKSGFLIHNIEGLGPIKAEINTTEVSSVDGSFFNSSRLTSRNIVIGSYLIENPSMEKTREKLYKYFPIKRRIKIVIETSNRICQTYGYVESNEISIFSKRENSTISIICPDPNLYSLNDSVNIFGFTDSLFEFPFSNESTSQKLLEFGSISTDTSKLLYYPGDIPIGLVFYIHASGAVNDLTISRTSTSESISIDSAILTALTGSDIKSGDDIIISTITGNKFVSLIRDGSTTNILNTVGKNPDWFKLDRGDNVFTYTADSGVNNVSIRTTNKIAYEGI